MADLAIISMDRQLEDPDIAEHCRAVETPDNHEAAIVQHCPMVPAGFHLRPVDQPPVPDHRHQVQEQDLVTVLHTVMAADYKQVAADDGRRMGEAGEGCGGRDGNRSEERGSHVKDPHIAEALAAVRAPIDNEFRAHHIRRVVATGFGDCPVFRGGGRGRRDQFPRHLIRVRDVKAPHIVESADAISPTKYINPVPV